ncbi:TMV resistance protein N-like [Cynara cardunculus var. scolymus]|uniref:TMV resistance protein N-like n=1 Tax=Cynara cardunculus var. scolymus TaxID=59895 RepID=UPI000D628594|nr:TMV resistance protein N-like [Cynara cardunculus var. scolymus]
MLGSIDEGISMMKSLLSTTSVLIVLDDVDHLDHLKLLAGSQDWFGEGSRIIITTRNKNLLKAHNINVIYNVRLLNQEEAIELFCWHAFGARRPAEGYEKLLVNIVSKFGGHPSALISLSSFLHDKDLNGWMQTSAKLEDSTVDEILELFRTRDDGEESYIDSWLGF